MGLDIDYYERVAYLDPQPSDDEYDALWETGARRLYAEPNFPGRNDDLKDGVYLVGGEQGNFRAGSYSGGYNRWREALSLAAHGVMPEVIWKGEEGDGWEHRPFFELLHFSDCEGVLGPQTCARLAADFVEMRETVLPKWDPDDPNESYYREKYDEWQHAFEIAANTGAVMLWPRLWPAGDHPRNVRVMYMPERRP